MLDDEDRKFVDEVKSCVEPYFFHPEVERLVSIIEQQDRENNGLAALNEAINWVGHQDAVFPIRPSKILMKLQAIRDKYEIK